MMNNILDNLCIKGKLGIGKKATYIKNVRERHPDIKVKDRQEYLKYQEVSKISTTVNKTYEYMITVFAHGYIMQWEWAVWRMHGQPWQVRYAR